MEQNLILFVGLFLLFCLLICVFPQIKQTVDTKFLEPPPLPSHTLLPPPQVK